MSVFESIAKAFGKSKMAPSVAALEQLEVDAQKAVEAARAKLAELEQGRVAAVLGGDQARLEHRERARTAEDDLKDAEVALAAIMKRLEQAREEAQEAERKQRYTEAQAKRDDAVQALRTNYPRLAAELADLLRQIAEADALVERANAALPNGAAPLPEVENVRDKAYTPEKIVGERTLVRWCFPGATSPLPESAKIRDDGNGRGMLIRSGGFDAEVHLQPFLEQKFRRAHVGEMGPRLRTMTLPGLHVTDAPHWEGGHTWQEGADVLRRLATPVPASAPEADAPVEVRLIPMPVQPAEAAE